MWRDVERGQLLLSESEVQGLSGALAAHVADAVGVPVGRLEDAIGEALAGGLQVLDHEAVEPVVVIPGSEPNGLQLVALLRSHRRDRGADPTPLDTAPDAFRAWQDR